MVTIDEKIKLFSKLINQSMDIQFTDELKELENNYESKVQKLKESVDREAREIEERARKKAEVKRAEALSKSKVIIKKDIMALKEKYYYVFMDKFNLKIKEFVASKDYKSYLSKIISNLVTEIKNYGKCDLVIYLSKIDNEKYSDFIKTEITKDHDCNINFKINPDITGGLIAEITDRNFKIDLTVNSLLEDSKSYIMQTIFETLEAGEING